MVFSIKFKGLKQANSQLTHSSGAEFLSLITRLTLIFSFYSGSQVTEWQLEKSEGFLIDSKYLK